MPIYQLGDLVPVIHPEAYIHPEAVLIGDVTVGHLQPPRQFGHMRDQRVVGTAILEGDQDFFIQG